MNTNASSQPTLTNDPVRVVVATDDNYVCQLAVMLISMFRFATTQPVYAHVIVPKTFASRRLLDQAVGRFADQLCYHIIDDQQLLTLRQREDLTAATYYRLLIDEILPPSVERVLYLDCDLLVRSDIAELWNISLDGHLVAAARDPGFASHDTLGLSGDAPYFNAGVLLIDLGRWRAEHIGQRAFDFATRHPQRLTFNDQCALNWVLRGSWLMLEARWNMQTDYFGIRNRYGSFIYFKEIPKSVTAAAIIHFNAPGRPWFYMDQHPFKRDYLAYKKTTPWRNVRPADLTWRNVVRRAAMRHAPLALRGYRFVRSRLLR